MSKVYDEDGFSDIRNYYAPRQSQVSMMSSLMMKASKVMGRSQLSEIQSSRKSRMTEVDQMDTDRSSRDHTNQLARLDSK